MQQVDQMAINKDTFIYKDIFIYKGLYIFFIKMSLYIAHRNWQQTIGLSVREASENIYIVSAMCECIIGAMI